MSAPLPPDLSPLTRFRDIHAGRRAVLVCNGPSLNGMDLRPLRHEIVFGLNKIHLGLQRFGFAPRYVAAVNDRVIAQAAGALAALPAVKFVTDRAGALLPPGPLVYHLRTTKVTEPFCRDIARGVREGHTVTFVALQILRYMGAAQVVIVGLDHRFAASAPPDAPAFLAGPDPNHFSPDYFGNQVWDAPNLAESESAFRIARQVYEAEGRRILDATPGGACPVFERADYARLFPATGEGGAANSPLNPPVPLC